MAEHTISGVQEHQQDGAWGAAIVAGAGDAILGLDRDGVNADCEEYFGWSAEHIAGQSPDRLIPVARRDELLRVLRASAGAPEGAALETERLRSFGDVQPVPFRVSLMFGASDEFIGVSAVVRDNSRAVQLRRQLQQARHLAEARFGQSVVAQGAPVAGRHGARGQRRAVPPVRLRARGAAGAPGPTAGSSRPG